MAPNLQMIFALPGVRTPPKFTVDKRKRSWKIEGSGLQGTRQPVVGRFLRQALWSGNYMVEGVLPAEVNVTTEPSQKLEDGLFIVTLDEHDREIIG